MLFTAIEWNAPMLLEYLLQNGGDVNSINQSDQSLLQVAVALNAMECLKV